MAFPLAFSLASNGQKENKRKKGINQGGFTVDDVLKLLVRDMSSDELRRRRLEVPAEDEEMLDVFRWEYRRRGLLFVEWGTLQD